MLIDTHAHLADKRFDADRKQAIERAKAAGVLKIIEIACEPHCWQKTIDLAEQNDGIYCAVGLHPQDAKLCTADVFSELERFAALPRVVAIGETGFDYHYENSPRDQQREVFIKHINLSFKTGKPLSIHCRDAYPDLFEVLNNMKCRGVIHCFSGSVKQAEKLVEMGFYLGIDGPATYPKSEELKKVVEAIPLDKLLLETDSPYLAPQQYRGKRNEPSYIQFIAQEIAKIKQIKFEEVAETTSRNADILFGFK